MKLVRQKVLEYHREFLNYIPDFTDYDDLQLFKTDVLEFMGKYQSFMVKEILSRNKLIKAF